MNKKPIIALLAIALLGSSAAVAVSYLRKPSNYTECVLSNLGKAESDFGARVLVGVCREQFPESGIINPYDFLDSDVSWEEFRSNPE